MQFNSTETIDMPKSATERLDELVVGANILVNGESKSKWYSAMARVEDRTDKEKQFTMRTMRDGSGEVRVWRIK